MVEFFYHKYLILILVLALVHFTRQILLYLHLWQMKQYRWDRLKESFHEDYRVLLPKSAVVSFLVLASFFVLPYHWFLLLALVNFIFWGSYALIQGVRKRWVYPRATSKGKVFFSFLWLATVALGLAGLFWAPLDLPFLLLAVSVIWPLVVLTALRIMEWPANILKNRLIEKAKNRRAQMKNLTVIGVAGSFGKTSVKEFLYHFLAEKYGQDKVLKTERNTNTQLGVAQTILNDLTSQHLFFICEMGAYRVGEITQSAELARPSIGILTGINNQHLSLFGSQENIIKAKYELIQSLPPTGYSIFNGDNDYCLDLYRQTSDRKILVSSKGLRLAHWQAQEVLIGKDSVSFKMANRDQEILISAKLVGRQNIVNLLLAGSAALVLGLSPNELSQAAKTLPTPSGGPRMVPYRQASIINAVYSSNLDGAQVHIEHLELWSGRRILVTPGFIELGADASEAHYQLGKSIGRNCHLAIFTHDRYLKSVRAGIAEVGGQTELILARQPEEIVRRLREFDQQDDVILFEGRIPNQVMDLLQSA